VVSQRSVEKLRIAIYEIYSDENLRHNLASVAQKFSAEHYDGDMVRTKFKNSFVLSNSASKKGENANTTVNSDLNQ